MIGVEPVRIDLLNRIDGVVFHDAYGRSLRGRYGAVEVTFIGREDLLQNTLAAGRGCDIGDIEELSDSSKEIPSQSCSAR